MLVAERSIDSVSLLFELYFVGMIILLRPKNIFVKKSLSFECSRGIGFI